MRSDIPTPILETLHDLAPDALVELFKIQLADASLVYLSPKGAVTWQGNTYDDLPCNLTEISKEAEGKLSRPKFSFVNPAGLFTAAIYRGDLDNAIVTRKRILKADLDADRDFAITEGFRVSKILNLNKTMVTVELRDALDGHHFVLPARAYNPPEFPHVKLQ